MTALERVLDALHARVGKVHSRADGAQAQCPAHDDGQPSLSVRHVDGIDDKGGRVLLHCHAGCDSAAVLDALELQWSDLYDDPIPTGRHGLERDHPYRSGGGVIIGSVQRLRTGDSRKEFRPVTRHDGRWRHQSSEQLKSTPYRLVELVAALERGDPVYVVEGERDADSLAAVGVTATCNSGGAKKWTETHAAWLRGADVVVCRDRDQAGRDHADLVVASLHGIAASVRLVEPSVGKDVTEHLAEGRQVKHLVEVPLPVAADEPLDTPAESAQTAEPLPLSTPRAPAPFPLDALPAWVRDYARALSTATQTPPDLAGCAVLGVLAACAGGRAVVEARAGWREPCCLYLLPVLPPGSRKSAVIGAATQPLYAVERDLLARVQPQLLEARTARDVAQRAADHARNQAAKASAEEQRRDMLSSAITAAHEAEAVTEPVVPRLVADDVTPEAVGTLLAEHGGRLAIISAEGGVFDTMAGRYSNGVPSLDVFLKGHAGDTLRVDRRGRPPEYVERPALTVLLSVQPAVLSAIARNGTFRGRGLTARFLYSLPHDNVGRRAIAAPSVPDHVAAAYADRVAALAEDLIEWTDPLVLQLAPDAHDVLLEAERRIEPQLTRDGSMGAVREWGSKLAGAMVRLAGLLHLAEHQVGAHRVPISAATMTAAVQLGGYFAEHARAAFDALGDNGASDAAYVLEHLRDHGHDEFTIRQLTTDLPRGRFPGKDEVVAAVAVLEEHGWCWVQPAPERKGPGRPPSPRYSVHDRVHAGPTAVSAQSAEPAPTTSSADSADIASTPAESREAS